MRVKIFFNLLLRILTTLDEILSRNIMSFYNLPYYTIGYNNELLNKINDNNLL